MNSHTETGSLQRYLVKVEPIIGELGRQLNRSRVTGISGTEGLVVYTKKGPYFAQVFNVSRIDGEATSPVQRDSLNEDLQGAIEADVKRKFDVESPREFYA